MLNILRTDSRFPALIAMTALIVGLFLSPAPVNSEEESAFTAFVQKFASGRIDWENGIVYGTGRAFLDKSANSVPMAMRAAQIIAASNILKIAAGINLDEQRKLGQLGDGNFVIRLKAFLRFSEHDARLVDNTARPYYEVTRKTRLSGISGLNVQILKQMNTIGEGFRFPQREARPIVETETDPWLVLDARDLTKAGQVTPALFPKITAATGAELFSLGTINPAALEQRPMISYVESTADIQKLQSVSGLPAALAGLLETLLKTPNAIAGDGKTRKKRRRFIVKKAAALAGLSRTNLVISQNDALALQKEDEASSILKNCRVIVIVSSPVGGVEGRLPEYVALQ